mgnify:CR=1 FL=1
MFASSKADLGNMLSAGGGVSADKVIQKVQMSVSDKAVNEETTEYEEAHRCLPDELRFDKPFVYAIIDNATNIPVYLGVVTSL